MSYFWGKSHGCNCIIGYQFLLTRLVISCYYCSYCIYCAYCTTGRCLPSVDCCLAGTTETLDGWIYVNAALSLRKLASISVQLKSSTRAIVYAWSLNYLGVFLSVSRVSQREPRRYTSCCQHSTSSSGRLSSVHFTFDSKTVPALTLLSLLTRCVLIQRSCAWSFVPLRT